MQEHSKTKLCDQGSKLAKLEMRVEKLFTWYFLRVQLSGKVPIIFA